MDQINLDAWLDRSEIAQGEVSAQTAATVHAVLGQPGTDAPRQGEVLPALWHWYGFPPRAGMDALGPDGHPRYGTFLPPMHLDRRMWAGGSVEFVGALRVGDPLTRATRIADIARKDGAAGELVVVTLEHEISGPRGVGLRERQTIVYLQIPDTYVPPRAKQAPVPDVQDTVEVSTALLFRYSAITFNAHRIHYDLPYTQQTEHYPDLLVHGPLQAQGLIDMATRHRGHAPSLFSYRGIHPLFAGDGMRVSAVKKSDAEWTLCTVADAGHQCMQATAIWEV